MDEGRLRFVIPTTVSPRYAPAVDRMGTGRSDEEALNPPVAWSVPYGLNLSIRLAMPGGISAVESPSHPISLELNERDATVTLGQQDAALDRDFVLSIEARGLESPHAVVERRRRFRCDRRGIRSALCDGLGAGGAGVSRRPIGVDGRGHPSTRCATRCNCASAP